MANGQNYLLAIVTSMLLGCASVRISITSVPEGADVYLANAGGSKVKIGVTPLAKLNPPIESGKPTRLVVEKEGFVSEHILIANGALSTDHEFNAILDKIPEAEAKAQLPEPIRECKDVPQKAVNDLASSIATVQVQIKNRQLNEAESKLSFLINNFDYVSVLYDLMGNIQLARKDMQGALNYYKKSLAIDPNNLATTRIVSRLEQLDQGSP